MSYTAAVITISDKGARGERVDTSGPAICAILESKGWNIAYTGIIPDEKEQIKSELIKCADDMNNQSRSHHRRHRLFAQRHHPRSNS